MSNLLYARRKGEQGARQLSILIFMSSYIFSRKRGEERPDFVNGKDEQGRMHTEGDRGTLS